MSVKVESVASNSRSEEFRILSREEVAKQERSRYSTIGTRENERHTKEITTEYLKILKKRGRTIG